MESKNTIVQKATEAKSKKESLQTKLNQMREWLKSANDTLTLYNESTTLIQNSTNLLNGYQSQIQNQTSSYNTKSVNKEIEGLQKSYEELSKEHVELEHELNTYKVCRDLIGGKNFYGYYISVFRKYLNKSINEYLQKMASSHRVKFNNDLEADVFDGEQSVHSYDNLSTGEKSKINIALLLSFFDVLNSFHRMETSLLVLDEVLDTGLDTSAVRLLLNILQEKVNEKPDIGIYVVSHKDSNSSFASQENAGKIVFQKRLGFTTIKEN
jgi:DNA repair exonuclease SbcCD ATPase subunit